MSTPKDPTTPLDPTTDPAFDPSATTATPDPTTGTTAAAPAEYVAAAGDVVATDSDPRRYGIVVAVGEDGPEVAFLPPAGAYGLALVKASDV